MFLIEQFVWSRLVHYVCIKCRVVFW